MKQVHLVWRRFPLKMIFSNIYILFLLVFLRHISVQKSTAAVANFPSLSWNFLSRHHLHHHLHLRLRPRRRLCLQRLGAVPGRHLSGALPPYYGAWPPSIQYPTADCAVLCLRFVSSPPPM